jgi:hypothetical protein
LGDNSTDNIAKAGVKAIYQMHLHNNYSIEATAKQEGIRPPKKSLIQNLLSSEENNDKISLNLVDFCS